MTLNWIADRLNMGTASCQGICKGSCYSDNRMKYYRRIYINEQGFPPELYAQIVQLSPESCRPGVFMLEAQPGDEIQGQLCEKIAALCEQWGLKRTAGDPGTYGYGVARNYEP